MRLLETVRPALVRGLVVVSSLALLAPPATASVMRFLSIEELAAESTAVVRARIVGQSVHWTGNHEGIYTRIEAVVIGDVKGEPGRPGALLAGRRLTIIQAGGEIDGVSLDWTGRPTFRDGEDLVLFLQPYDPAVPSDDRLLVVGGKQGRMRVLEDPSGRSPVLVQRDLQGVLGTGFVEGEAPAGPPKRLDLVGFDELRRRVAAAGGAR